MHCLATPGIFIWSLFPFKRDTTHTHTGLMALCPGLPRWASTRKVKPVWILLKQETVSGISWAICKSAPCSRQITTPAPHRSVFLQAGCPSCYPKQGTLILCRFVLSLLDSGARDGTVGNSESKRNRCSFAFNFAKCWTVFFVIFCCSFLQ